MDRYQALSKMCLNNWHYINEKILNFHEEINFFTGHSGSGKSTVLDALQIVLYADSNGRAFFNKAAKEDSDRTLIEYLRGMKVVQDNNEISYLRNKNFSTTIVLEFEDTETKKCQCMGVIFDVDVSVNDTGRMFFWHTGGLAPNHYRDGEKALSIGELKDYIQEHYSRDEYYFSRTNEKFRNELYSNYFGGLHPKHFPALFKKAIPFKMDMKLEDFVKNYICTENDIHMEDMQDSVAQYTRLKRRLEDTKKEISLLTEIHEQYERYVTHENQMIQYQYHLDRLDITSIETKLDKLKLQQTEYQEDLVLLEKTITELEQEIKKLQLQRDEVTYSIQNSGYEHLEAELSHLNHTLELLHRSKASYDKMARGLSAWMDAKLLAPGILQNIEQIRDYSAAGNEFMSVKEELAKLHTELEQERQELLGSISEFRQKGNELSRQMAMLKDGQKAYPSYLLEAKDYLTRELEQAYEVPIRIDILADAIEVKNEQWRNAVEGYMGSNKLCLMVPPAYAKHALELYRNLEPKRFYRVSLIDTESVLKDSRPVRQGALAEELEATEEYIKAYVDYLMGGVIKCNSVEELRSNKSGITADCVLYQGYKLQHINSRNYTEEAYIGRSAVERRLHLLEQSRKELQAEKEPLEQQLHRIEELLSKEHLSEELTVYENMLQDIREIFAKELEKDTYQRRIQELKQQNIDEWRAKKALLEQAIEAKSRQKEQSGVQFQAKAAAIQEFKEMMITLSEELLQKQNLQQYDFVQEEAYQLFLKEQENKKPELVRGELLNRKQYSEKQMNEEYDKLLRRREQYHQAYAYRGFSLTERHNREYDQLLDNLSSDKLAEFTRKANEQATQAAYHFKTDFVYKIRDAIKEVMQQKEDLNRILAQLDFGKDKYKFIITKNRGNDGKFYEMFMDENLEINPSQLTGNTNHQMNLFSMQHEKDYSDLINELIDLFLPPENCDTKQLEEARMNMEKYADYRTYLSFDMEQLVEGMPPMRLSRMLSKNSGGEGQNPLYVALLASFAQVYRINLKSSVHRRPTPRLVVLDEAFSKMDAEKVGSCIGLIRKLGFQAIISATNDKIQNYVDNVDKTFVFANPNKNRISVQEFEKREFVELLTSSEEEE